MIDWDRLSEYNKNEVISMERIECIRYLIEGYKYFLSYNSRHYKIYNMNFYTNVYCSEIECAMMEYYQITEDELKKYITLL